MRLTLNKKGIILLLMMAMTLLTINQAMAENFNISTTGSAWRHVDDDLVATATGTYEITYYDSTGIDRTVNTTPYSASNIINFGLSPQSDYTYVSKEDFVFLNIPTKEIIYVDYGTSSISNVNASSAGGWVDSDSCGSSNFVDAFAITDDYIYYTRCVGGNLEKEIMVMSFTGGYVQNLSVYGGDDRWLGCSWSDTYSSYTCGDIFIDYQGGNIYNAYVTQEQFNYNDYNMFRVTKYVLNETNSSHIRVSSVSSIATLNLPYNDLGMRIFVKGCYEDGSEIICSFPASSPRIYTFYKSGGYSVSYPESNPITRNDIDIEASFKDENQDTDEMFINDTGAVYVYDTTSGDLLSAGENAYNEGVYRFKQFSSGILLQDALIYQYSSSNYRFKTFDELSTYSEGTPPPPTEENVSYITINSTNDFTGSDLRTLLLLDNDEVLVGGSIFGTEGVIVVDYSDPQNVSSGAGIETDYVYSTDKKTSSSPQKISVGTSNGIYSMTYDGSVFTFRTRDHWGLFHADDVYDVVTDDYNNYVCDVAHEELDYNVEYYEPTDRASTECYDMERHGDYLYVDAGQAGINVYDISSNSSAPYENHIDIRSTSNGLLYGDLLDIDGDVLVGIRDADEMVAYNITSDSSETEITVCDVGGLGTIISVELLGTSTAIAGTSNGRIAYCDLTKEEGENVVVYEPITSNEITAIEYDGSLIHILAEDEYIISQVENYTVNLTTNTPPTLENYSVSDTTPEINQTVTVTITAGNVETLDVIRYGIKCDSEQTNYTYNLLGQFECTYEEAGATTMTIAVTDNYHIGTWYDETNISITVLPTVFTGGLINVEVIDDETEEYVVGASVTADGTTVTTDSFGRATITTSEETTYLTTATATGYYDLSQTLLADGSYYVMRMNSLGESNETNLVVTITNNNGTAIEGALVSYTNGITYNYDYTFTDLNGKAYFNNIDSGLTVVQASATYYEDGQRSINIISTTTNQVDITLDGTGNEITGTLREDRNCIDDGLWLCGGIEVVEHSCTQNSDCLSDQCTKGVNKCSRFNYSRCDDAGLPRNQQCITKLTAENALGKTTNWFLTNLVWVILLLILLISAGMIFISWKK